MSWLTVGDEYSSKYKTKRLSLAKRPLLNGTFTKEGIEHKLKRRSENRGK
ncbi:hypothetical protein RJP56_11570 [Shewanella baltica]|nr:hypothetical protein [Shewanella baltica]MCS6128101.1 hypothetical protein [Shewanella baltica]MCS6140032.1 hypothetical protein [Shewanella baltica]MCS6146173.1 hypothetical protein [Shewanella baltica]MCS6170845.1 hypothetical protein [Shewanella baltica]MCS6187927.1 hypothetical protein [Shewanella baltica]